MAKKKKKKKSEPELIGLRIDIETRSRRDLTKTGVYPYVECPEFAVLAIGYAPILNVDGEQALGKARKLDLSDQDAIDHFVEIITNPKYIKVAFNAQFERVALSRWLGMPTGHYLDPKNWWCSKVHAATYGVFGSLDEVAKVLGSPVHKDPAGRRLMGMFSKPDRYGNFVEPEDARFDFSKYEDYCVNDVTTEAVAVSILPPMEAGNQRDYERDQRINDRGFKHNELLSLAAVDAVAAESARLMAKLRKMTGVENPNSTQQMQAWLAAQDYPMEKLDKEARTEALLDPEIPPKVAKALTLKGKASLTSVSKHKAALATRCADGRIRGSLQFYGAHTGREAGRGIQPQNLPRYEAPAEDIERLLRGKAGKDAPEIAKGCVRASIVPERRHVFAVVDYNAIEARVLGNLAGEQWVEDEFHKGAGAIYEATAAVMFNAIKEQLIADLKKCGKCGKATCLACTLRGQGKVSNLALGYAGGASALVTMGAEDAGIDIGNFKDLRAEYERSGVKVKFHEWEPERHDYPELLRLRDLYRQNSPATVSFWKQCGMAWDAASKGKSVRFGNHDMLAFMRDGRNNRLVLPSGRSIYYPQARSLPDPDRKDRIDRRTYMGKSQNVGHTRIDTHGGKLTENVTQAVARDVLFELVEKIEKKTAKGWPGRLVLHVHDEVVLECKEKHGDQVLADVKGWMSESPKWAPTLALRGAGELKDVYGK